MPRQAEVTSTSVKRKRSPIRRKDGQETPGDNSSSGSRRTDAYAQKRRALDGSQSSNSTPRNGLPSTGPAVVPSPPRQTSASPPRKRPGGGRINPAAQKAAEARRLQREEEDRKSVAARPHGELVSAHYNAVPQRGREWRRNESQIKGLRSLNNWIKSCLIQKFSRPEIPTPNLLVLDIGCGKGGDIGKWQSAPQCPALYVGVDPAQVSIDQAMQRYNETSHRRRGPLFEGHFYVKDCFGTSLGQLPVVQQVGFDPNAGPDVNGQVQMRTVRGGFDVVSMMFCLHYSYESEDMARGMLKNVVGALKKGGRFLGVMPNSDVISAHVARHLSGKSSSPTAKKAEKSMYDDDEDDWDPEKPSEEAAASTKANEEGEDEWDPEKPIETAATATADDDDWNPEATMDAPTEATKTPPKNLPPLEWGNDIYKVSFPQDRPLPLDGVFRPPYGWKYFYFLEEAVNVPEYVVPWEGFRALAAEYGLELLYRKPFDEIYDEEKNDAVLGPLCERMGVQSRDGRSNVSEQELDAARFYHAFCFYKI